MKITYVAAAHTVDTSTNEWVEPPRQLDGLRLPGHRLDDYLDSPLADLGVVGGEMHVAVENGKALLVIDYWTPQPLAGDELALLTEFTNGQLSDGVGESGFEVSNGDLSLLVVPIDDPPIRLCLKTSCFSPTLPAADSVE